MSQPLYKTYLFKDKDPVIHEVEDTMKREGFTIARIEALSGVTANTMRNWFYGATKRPNNATVQAVMRAMGYQAKWVKRP